MPTMELWATVVKNMTDTIFLDDLDSKVPMKTFMNMVTGKMTIDVKHGKGFTLDYIESPKLGALGDSSHATAEKGRIIVSLCAEGAGPVKVEIPAE